MVNLNGPDTTASQFLITTARAPYLDGRHVVIGKVIAGHDVVDAIEIEGMKKGDLIVVEMMMMMITNYDDDIG